MLSRGSMFGRFANTTWHAEVIGLVGPFMGCGYFDRSPACMGFGSFAPRELRKRLMTIPIVS
jgi:hypothetical protein